MPGLTLAGNAIQYNTIYLFSIKHITMFIAYTFTYINVVKKTTISPEEHLAFLIYKPSGSKSGPTERWS